MATGEKVSKSSRRIEAYGTIDELNAVVGMLRDALTSGKPSQAPDDLAAQLLLIQNELFDLGGELAVTNKFLDTSKQQVVGPSEIRRLEMDMDRMNESLPPLENFILPGGHIVNSTAHLARTVCRRAERRLVELAEHEDVRDEAKIYLNRLSDWLFVACRALSARLEVREVLWNQRGK